MLFDPWLNQKLAAATWEERYQAANRWRVGRMIAAASPRRERRGGAVATGAFLRLYRACRATAVAYGRRSLTHTINLIRLTL